MALGTLNTIGLSAFANSALVRLQAKMYEKSYTALPNTALPKAESVALKIIFDALAPAAEMPESTVLIKANDGIYARTYGPVLVKHGGVPCVKWGNEFFPLANKSKVVKLKVSTFKFNTQYEDLCVYLTVPLTEESVYFSGTSLRLPLAVRIDVEKTTASTEELSEYELEELLELLFEDTGKPISDNSRSSNPVLPLSDLEDNCKIEIVKYRNVTTSYGTTQILTAIDGSEYWAAGTVKSILASNPIVSSEFPAMLTLISRKLTKSGKTSLNLAFMLTSPNEEDELVLDW